MGYENFGDKFKYRSILARVRNELDISFWVSWSMQIWTPDFKLEGLWLIF